MVWSEISSVIQGEIDNLVRVKDEPLADFGFGGDLDCAFDLTDDMAELDGDDILVLVQACLRRLNTVRGSLPQDGDPEVADYGFDLCGMLNRGMTQKDLLMIEGRIASELGKDDRIETVEAAVSLDANGEMTVTIKGTTRTGTFEMTMGVTAASVTLLGYK